MFPAIFKKKNVVEEKASKSAYDQLYPPILKLCPLKMSHYGRLWRAKPDFAAVSRTHDMHRIALLIRTCASLIFFFYKKKRLLPSACSRLYDPNQNTHPRMSAHHEDPSKTANRSWKERQGKYLRQFFKRKMCFGEKGNSTVRF